MADKTETNPRSRRAPRSALTLQLLFLGPEGGAQEQAVPLLNGSFVLGRDAKLSGGIDLSADRRASRQHARIDVRDGVVSITDLKSANGSSVNGRLISTAVLKEGDIVRVGSSLLHLRHVTEPLQGTPEVFFVVKAPASRALARQIAKLAPQAEPVLILGESGVGKERVAEALHKLSPRSAAPFVRQNCAGLDGPLAESHLFGHTRGAFTGADSPRKGLFEEAGEGTLFLDEVGELPLEVQAKLLRVLDDRQVRPLGGGKTTTHAARVVAATNRSLEQDVKTGRFRGDLFSRLHGLVLTILPLRARREEILALVSSVLPEPHCFTAELAEKLLLYDWPYNVRQLLQVAQTLRREATPGAALDLPLLGSLSEFQTDAHTASPAAAAQPTRSSPLKAPPPLSKAELASRLEDHYGNLSKLGQALHRSRRQLVRWMEYYGLYRGDFLKR